MYNFTNGPLGIKIKLYYIHINEQYIIFFLLILYHMYLNKSKCILYFSGLAYLQYFFNWKSHFVLNTQWQVVVGFNLHILFS